MNFDVAAYLAGKGLAPRAASGGREVTVPCFADCDEPAHSRKRKMYVNVEEGFWHCHVCGCSGGAVSLQRTFGDEPKPTTTEDPFIRRRILDWATELGQEMLVNSDDVLLWLMNERGLSPETILERKLGFVGNGWSLTGSLPGEFTKAQLATTGLVHKDGPKAGRDYFYRHLLIPVISRGHVVQIRGRSWGESGARYMSGPGESVRIYNVDALDGAEDVIITEGELDCYSGDTEVFTKNGWVRFDEYLPGEEVLQFEEGGALRFVKPAAFFSQDDRELTRLATKRAGGVDLVVTPGHRMVSTLPSTGQLMIHRADERPSDRYHIPRAGSLDGVGIDHSNDEIALLIAISADATIDVRKRDGHQYARFGFAKQRKVDRLLGILDRLGLDYSAEPIAGGITSICFRVPGYLSAFKVFPQRWLVDASCTQREFILSELLHWDGNHVSDRAMFEFSSKLEENATWVQMLAHTAGRVATIQHRENAFGRWLKVSILENKRSTSWQSVVSESAERGAAYCVQVPSGMLLVRRAEQVAVSGNCIVLADALAKLKDPRAQRVAVIGLSGTSAIPDDLEDRLSTAKRVYIGFDADDAGRKAAAKLKDKLGKNVRILEIPDEGADWSDWLLPRKANDPEWSLAHPHAGHDGHDVLRLLSHASGRRIFSMAELAVRYREYRAQNPGLKTGWTILDQAIMPGLMPGQIVFILAKTGVGKSVICANLAFQMRRHRILWLSLEMTGEETYHRLERVFYHHFPSASQAELEYSLDNIWVCDENRLAGRDLYLLIDEYELEVGAPPEIVIVDYLGYFARGLPGSSGYDRTTGAALHIKEVGKNKKCVFFVPSQVSKGAKDGERFDMDDARDSGVVAETGDFVLTAWNPDNAQNNNLVIQGRPKAQLHFELAKSRHGNKGTQFVVQMDLLTLALAEEGSPQAKVADQHNFLHWRGHTWDELRAEETQPVQEELGVG